jgi:phospholipid-binding lipoprotein MlaA
MKGIAIAVGAALLVGCAVSRVPAPEHDPIEGFNRKIFWFNDQVDDWVLVPVATGWDKVTPDAVQHSVSNFFANLRFPIVATNDVLQGKVVDGAADVGRFVLNSTLGVVGLFDPATGIGLVQHNEDFGQTLAVWGVPPGPYLVLPLLGPSSPRETVGLVVDGAFSVTTFFADWWVLGASRAIDVVNERARVLDEVHRAKEASFDYYSFLRNAYAQHRTALVNDSGEKTKEEEDELYTIPPP